MSKDTVIGVGVGLLVGWLLWRRRQMALATMAGTGGGGCAGCAGGSLPLAPRPGACAQALSAGTGNYSQGSGPTRIPNF